MEDARIDTEPDLVRHAAEAAETQPERVDPDLEPLGHDDVAAEVAAITASRKNLLAALEAAGSGALERREQGGDGWPVRRILVHIAGGELYFLNRLGLADRLPEQQPDVDPLPLLDETRRQVLNVLTGVDDAWLAKAVAVDGETWTLRKVLRRLREHEAEHLARVRTILAG